MQNRRSLKICNTITSERHRSFQTAGGNSLKFGPTDNRGRLYPVRSLNGLKNRTERPDILRSSSKDFPYFLLNGAEAPRSESELLKLANEEREGGLALIVFDLFTFGADSNKTSKLRQH